MCQYLGGNHGRADMHCTHAPCPLRDDRGGCSVAGIRFDPNGNHLGSLRMPTATVNGVRLHYDLVGDGPPLVLVHGSWGDGTGWDLALPALAQRFRVLVYDRRGYSRSERPSTQGSTDEDVDDLAALITHLGLGPAHVAGTSSGAALALRLAARYPDMVRSVIGHEPPLYGPFVDDPDQGPLMREALSRFTAVVDHLEAGETEAGTRLFAETYSHGPGGWDRLPPERRQVMIGNAPTWIDEMRDPGAWSADLAALAAIPHPILLTYGDQSLPFLPAVVANLAGVLPSVQTQRITGAGHVPGASHPAEYAAAIMAFTAAADIASNAPPG
jgi:pimeloyl-ACP methyl ester carboxylesterase